MVRLDDRAAERVDAGSSPRHDRNHRAAEAGRQPIAIDRQPPPFTQIDHRQGDDGRQPEGQQLGGEKEVAREVGGIDHHDRHVRAATLGAGQLLSTDLGFRQVEVEAVEAGQGR